MTTANEQITELYAAKRAAGLVDVKVLLKDTPPSEEAFCADHLRLQEAIAAGKVRPLSFGGVTLKRTGAVRNPRTHVSA